MYSIPKIMKKHPGWKPVLLPSIILLLIVVIASIFFVRATHHAATVTYRQLSGSPAVYYVIHAFPQDTTSHATYTIYRRTASGEQIQIAVVNDESQGNQPSFLLLPDESALIVSYPDHVFSLDPHTGLEKLIYTAQYKIVGTLLSPDQSSLFFWDGDDSAVFGQPYVAVSYSLKDSTLTTFGKGTFDPGTGYSLAKWVRNDLVTIGQSTRDFSGETWQYNPITNTLTDTGIFEHPFYFSNDDDSRQAVPGTPSSAATTLCTDPYAIAPSTYTVQNSKSATLGSFSIPNKQVEVEYFSPDSTQALLRVYDLPATADDCGNKNNVSFYLTSFDGTTPHKIDSYNAQFTTWKIPLPVTVDSSYNNDAGKTTFTILLGQTSFYVSEPLDNTRQELMVIGAIQ